MLHVRYDLVQFAPILFWKDQARCNMTVLVKCVAIKHLGMNMAMFIPKCSYLYEFIDCYEIASRFLAGHFRLWKLSQTETQADSNSQRRENHRILWNSQYRAVFRNTHKPAFSQPSNAHPSTMCHHSYEQHACTVTRVFFTKALHQGLLVAALLHCMMLTTLFSPVAAIPEPEFIVRVELGEHKTKERIINVSAIVLRDAANNLSLQINTTILHQSLNTKTTIIRTYMNTNSANWGRLTAGDIVREKVSYTHAIESSDQCEHRFFVVTAVQETVVGNTNITNITVVQYMVQAIHPSLGSIWHITIALP